MGDDLAIVMATEAVALTGAQKGSTPLAKVITGGSFRIVVPFKQIELANFQRGFPNAIFTAGPGGERVDFLPRVGVNMLTLARPMRIVKVFGEVESALPADRFNIFKASRADTEVTIPFSPTEQRVISATFEVYPDDTQGGRWAYIGDEFTT
jgi:hypothetical protein